MEGRLGAYAAGYYTEGGTSLVFVLHSIDTQSTLSRGILRSQNCNALLKTIS